MRRGVLAGGMVAGAAMLGGCWPLVRHASCRIRLHVEVMTPQGLKAGSGVLELVNDQTPTFGVANISQGGVALLGQAVIVDLPDGPVFVLLRLPNDADSTGLANLIEDGLVPHAPLDTSAETGIAQNHKIGSAAPGTLRADLPPETAGGYNGSFKSWPMMVRFKDLTDPKSVESVDPQAFGVRRVWVENTDAPVTKGIEKRLGWLGDAGLSLDPDSGITYKPTLAQTIYQGAFWQGPAK